MTPNDPDLERALQLARRRQRTHYYVACRRCGAGGELLGLLATASRRVCFYWGSDDHEIVALGQAAVLSCEGPERFLRLSAQRRELRARTLGALPDELLLVGGFGFDDRGPGADSPWASFSAARLVLPEILLQRRGGSIDVAVVVPVQPDDEPGQIEQRLAAGWAEVDGLLDNEPPGARAPAQQPILEEIEPVGALASWGRAVDEAASRCADPGDPLIKVVLARALRARAQGRLSPVEILSSLRARFPRCAHFLVRPEVDGACFLGASPEWLVRREGRAVEVDALAGSAAPSQGDAALLESRKDRLEHGLVVDTIVEALRPLCGGDEAIEAAATPSVLRLDNVIHLHTPIRAQLTAEDPPDVLELADRLHPTPAVCGLPRGLAREHIAAVEQEQMEDGRGWYAGGVGFCGLGGDGAFAVAIRSAFIKGASATVFTGAGVVDGSRGALEIEETRIKARALLEAMGGEGAR